MVAPSAAIPAFHPPPRTASQHFQNSEPSASLHSSSPAMARAPIHASLPVPPASPIAPGQSQTPPPQSNPTPSSPQQIVAPTTPAPATQIPTAAARKIAARIQTGFSPHCLRAPRFPAVPVVSVSSTATPHRILLL